MNLAQDEWTFQNLSGTMTGVALSEVDWRRLGEQVARRRTELGLTQADVSAAGGPSVATMRLIEGGMQASYRDGTLTSLERALRWQHGSVSAVLAGGDPTPSEDERTQDLTQIPPELRQVAAVLTSPIIPAHAKRDLLYGIDMAYRFWLERHASPSNPDQSDKSRAQR